MSVGCGMAPHRPMLSVARVEVLHLIHDPTTISLILLVPAIQIVLFGYAVNLDPRNIPIAIAGDHNGRAPQLRSMIRSTGYFAVSADGLEPGAAERMVKQGEAVVGIELVAEDRSDDGQSGEPKVFVDATDPAAVRPALAALESAYWQHVAQLNAIGPLPPVDVEWLYNPEGRTAWTIVPGLAGVVVMISMLMLGALTLVRERELGSWETLLATVDAIDALVGKLSPYVVIGTVQAGTVIYLARLLFDLPVTGNLCALLLATPLYAAAHLILGFAISSVTESQSDPGRGFFLPALNAPVRVHISISRNAPVGTGEGGMLPLTHFVRATRAVLLRGAGASFVTSEMLPVALFAVAAAVLALGAYRRRID